MASIIDIGRKTKVSTATVSRVLNNKDDLIPISKETKEKVLKAAKDLNYHPNLLARSLVQKKSNTIGLIIPSVSYSFFPEVTKGIEAVLNENGYKLILCHSDEDSKKERGEFENLLERRVDGLIIAPAQEMENLTILQELKEEKFPFVLIDRHYQGENFNCVLTNDEEAAFEAVDYLISLGHKRIGYIAGPSSCSTSKERFSGYKKALIKSKIPFEEELVIGNGFNEEDGYKAMKRFFQLKELPTAIFCINDPAAIGTFKAIKEKGLNIPDDISLIGFANLSPTEILEIPLTTVNQPKHQMGEVACKRLLEIIEKKDTKPKKIILESKLIIRSSTKRLDKRS